MSCPRCRGVVRAEDRYCRRCGSALEPTTETLAEPIPTEAAPSPGRVSREQPIIQIHSGRLAGTVCTLGPGVTRIGRDPTSDVFLDDITVSRRHAEIRSRQDGRYELEDHGSLNGTYLEGVLIDGPATLENRCHIRIGRYSLTFYARTES